MAGIRTRSEYMRTLDIIVQRKRDLFRLVEEKGTLHPEVLELSAEVDRYIVEVQQYWQRPNAYEVG